MIFTKELSNPFKQSSAFADKFSDNFKDRKQLQRFLGCLNYVSDFFPKLRQLCSPLYKILRKNPSPWTDNHTKIVQQVKLHVKSLPCLGIPNLHAFMIVETDAFDIGYGGILKQKLESQTEQLVRFHSDLWHGPQQKYSIIKKEILAIVLCISKFQDDLFLKNSFSLLITNLPKKFYKRVYKT